MTFQSSEAVEPAGGAIGVTDHELPSQWLTEDARMPLLRSGKEPPTAQQFQALAQVLPSSRSLSPEPVDALVTMFQPDGAAGALGTANRPTASPTAAATTRKYVTLRLPYLAMAFYRPGPGRP